MIHILKHMVKKYIFQCYEYFASRHSDDDNDDYKVGTLNLSNLPVILVSHFIYEYIKRMNECERAI